MHILTTIGIIASFFIFAIFLYLGIKARTSGVTALSSQYIIKGKLFGEPTDVRDFVALKYNIKEEAKNLKEDTELATVIKTYNFVEEGYHYALDNLVLLNEDLVLLKGNTDSWNPAWLSLAIKHQSGGLNGDCEDITALIIALLRVNNIDVWDNVGTVTLSSGIYGHSWGTVIIEGKEYLLEGTLEAPLVKLQSVPNFYKANIKFNEKDVLAITGADINKELPPQLPPARLNELKQALGN